MQEEEMFDALLGDVVAFIQDDVKSVAIDQMEMWGWIEEGASSRWVVTPEGREQLAARSG